MFYHSKSCKMKNPVLVCERGGMFFYTRTKPLTELFSNCGTDTSVRFNPAGGDAFTTNPLKMAHKRAAWHVKGVHPIVSLAWLYHQHMQVCERATTATQSRWDDKSASNTTRKQRKHEEAYFHCGFTCKLVNEERPHTVVSQTIGFWRDSVKLKKLEMSHGDLTSFTQRESNSCTIEWLH